jgi:ABC-2 type transport system ATP-binding protein
MDEAEYLCDRVAIVDHGKILKLDTPDNLIDELLVSGFTKEEEAKQAT